MDTPTATHDTPDTLNPNWVNAIMKRQTVQP